MIRKKVDLEVKTILVRSTIFVHFMKISLYIFLLYIFVISCNKEVNDLTNTSDNNEPWPYKVYEFDSDGNILSCSRILY